MFKAFPKLTRLNGPVFVTEKIDGTNACIIVQGPLIFAQSRTRIISPESDNFGFAKWVVDNRLDLITMLGDGYHYGEWWGKGIQRGYGMPEKRFSLFNTQNDVLPKNGLVYTVPLLYKGPFDTDAFDRYMLTLEHHGSFAAPGFMKPEGIVIYDEKSGHSFKRTYEYPEGKWLM